MKYVEDVLKELKSTSIAVVGNAEITERHGEAIDSHVSVIRFNRYVIDAKYKEFVGAKTTLWCVGSNMTMDNSYGHDSAICPYFATTVKIDGCALYTTQKSDLAVMRYMLKPKFPSTGFALLYLFNKLGIAANVFGFDFLTSAHYWNKEHKHSTAHSSVKEREHVSRFRKIKVFP